MKFPLRRYRLAWSKLFRLVGCVALLGGSLRASEYSVTSWGVDEGLPQSSVTDIAQTPDGFLWIGTLLSGVSRFDGVRFVNFDSINTPGLVNTRRLLVDSKGNLWVNGGDGSLFLKRGSTFEKVGDNIKLGSLAGEWPDGVAFVTLDGELVLGQVDGTGQWTWQRHTPPPGSGNYYFSQEKNGTLWFIGPGSKIGRFANNHFEMLPSPPGLVGKKIQALARDEAGQIWVGTDQELARWEHDSFTNLNPAGPASKILVKRIMPVSGGRIWLEVDGKLVCYEHGEWSEPVAEWDGNEAPWSHFRTYRSDNAGGLWISLNEGVVHVGRDRRLAFVTSADGLPGQWVQAFFADREGNLWAGYHRGGLVQVRQATFHSVARREGLLETLVTSVTEDINGAIWIGTAGGSVARWSDGVCTNFTLPLRGRFSQDAVVAAGPDGRVWVGTGGNGLLVWDQGQFQQVLLPDQISVDGVRQLLVAQNGDVWFANFSGLYHLVGKKQDRVLTPNATSQVVAALKEGPDGSIWLGTFGGVLRRWQDGKFTSFEPTDNVPATRFWALCPEADGTIWIGTMNGGLLRFKEGQFTRFTTADGLADNGISHILADDLGNLWLGSRVGVMCIAKKDLVPREARMGAIPCRLFGRSDGLLTVAMTLEFQPSCVKARDGTLWFGSPKGASWVKPDDVRHQEPTPMVLVESVLADNKMLEFSGGHASNSSPSVTVEPGLNNLEVRFTAPVFTAPELMRFKYRLDKLDADWIDLGGQRSVSFNHLPPGDYTFRVMAENSDGLWSSKPATFRLIVQPHFWERKSFQVGVFIVVLVGVALVMRRIMRQRFRRRLEALHQQQQIERERARIAQDLHDDLGAGLTEISLTSDLANNPSLPDYESRQYTGEIGSRARELVQRMDEIVWAVNPRNDSVVSLSVYACQYAQRILKPLDISCRLDVQPALPEITLNSEQRYNFFLAFKEAVANIAKHSGARELHLGIYTENGQLVFLLEDNGRGFQLGGEQPGADGLRNIRERLDRLHGQCEISSQPGQGTRVCLRVPLIVETAQA